MDLGLQGRRAVVTGGGRGIGLAIAEQLAQEGAHVAICGRERSVLSHAQTLVERHGTRVYSDVVDVADPVVLRNWIGSAAERLGGIDIIVHNASGAGGTGEESWRRNFAVDVMAFTHIVEHAQPHLEKSDAASVVALGSTAAIEAFANPAAPFGALKAALIHHVSGLARNLAPRGIRLNAVSPGPVFFEGGAWDRVQRERSAFYDEIVASIPRGSMGTPEEIARVVAFVASPATSYMTGVNVVLDGGMTKKIQFLRPQYRA
jgi:NAD(P)-dependent dehydrogenase (short-subunit alcohol dehydrogenase family)